MNILPNRRKHRSKQKPAVGALLCLELLLLLAAVSCQEYSDRTSQTHPEDLLGQPAALRSSPHDVKGTEQPTEALQQHANSHWSIRLAGDADLLPKWCKKPTEPALGSWHLLSDDEYTESAYAACAGVSAPTEESATRPNTRRIRKAKARSGKGRRLGAGERAASILTNTSTAGRCEAALQIPKVAMMFLTVGPMPHEPLWERWLSSAAGLVPTLCAANAICARGGLQVLPELQHACGIESTLGKSVYDAQHLFSVYIHASPDYPERPEGNVFYGRDTQVSRLYTKWADHSTVEVTRRLIKAALLDPLNQRFILLSESCVPLYSPLVVYQQLMHEMRSRISACAIPGIDLSSERYNIRMAAGRREHGRIRPEQWRKHFHWFSLLRSHAQLVANDTQIADTFSRDCFVGWDILHYDRAGTHYRFCLGDEHYVSTLLAVHGLDSQTDCLGRLTVATFDNMSATPEHPLSYKPEDVNLTLIRKLRGAKQEPYTALKFSHAAFHRMEHFTEEDTTWRVPYPDIKAMRPQLALFARKFPADTADVLLKLYLENELGGARLGIFGALDQDQGGSYGQ